MSSIVKQDQAEIPHSSYQVTIEIRVREGHYSVCMHGVVGRRALSLAVGTPACPTNSHTDTACTTHSLHNTLVIYTSTLQFIIDHFFLSLHTKHLTVQPYLFSYPGKPIKCN